MSKSAVITAMTRFPTTTEIKSAMEMASGSVEAAEYLNAQVKKLAEQSKFLAKNPELKAKVINAMQQFSDYVSFKNTVQGQPWAGQSVEVSEHKNFQNNLADEAIKQVTNKTQNIRMDYAIDEKGHYVRGYSANGEMVSSEAASALDRVFNAWLANNNLVIKGGFIYPTDASQIESNRLSAEQVRALISEKGLTSFMEQKGIQVEMKLREYPGARKEAQTKQDVTAAVQQARKEEQKTATSVEPQSGSTATTGAAR